MGLLQERFKNYREPQKFMEMGVYPYFRAISGKQGTEVEMEGQRVLMFGSNAYTGLTRMTHCASLQGSLSILVCLLLYVEERTILSVTKGITPVSLTEEDSPSQNS